MKFHPGFKNNRREIFAALAEKLQGDFEKGSVWKNDLVRARSGPWEVVMDQYTIHANNAHIPITRIRAPFLNKDGLRFGLSEEGFFQRLGKKLGMQDLEIGYRDFDRAFRITGNKRDQIRRLLEDDTLRQLLLEDPAISLAIKDDEGLFKQKYPKGVDLLYFQKHKHILDLPTLERFYALFSLVLERLVQIDSAYESDPGLTL